MLILPNSPLRRWQAEAWKGFFALRNKLNSDIANNEITNGYITFILKLHRRAGKDYFAFNLLVHEAYWHSGNYIYIFPYLKQVKKVVLEGVMKDGRRFLDLIPKKILIKIDKNEGTIYIRNAQGGVSTIWLSHSGADGLIGSSTKGIVCSEYALAQNDIIKFMSQSVKENNGFILVVSTPRGRNHFYDLFNKTLLNPYGIALSMGINETKNFDGTPLFTWKEIVDSIKFGEIPDIETAEQEYLVSWDSSNSNSFYKIQLKIIEEEGRHLLAKYNRNLPVECSFDLGTSDTCVLTFAQYNSSTDTIDVIGTYSNNYQDIDHYFSYIETLIETRGWNTPEVIYLPHDANKKSIETMTSIYDMSLQRGLYSILVPKIDRKILAIKKVRKVLHKCRFNDSSFTMFDNLKRYQKKYDKVNAVFTDEPVHDDSSHWADSIDCLFRGMEIRYGNQLTARSSKVNYK